MVQGKDEHMQREMASLTKIMTSYTVCKFCLEFNIPIQNTYVEVSKFASVQIGTSACFQSGDLVSIKDLLHGLLMPSGNDSAVVLAENFGMLVYFAALKRRRKFLKEEKDLRETLKTDFTATFVSEMN
jgi:D-alanyl-D-alanine carboxypeptidase